MSRKVRGRDVSSSPEPHYIEISDDSDELGTTDLTLSILAKAEKRERRRAKAKDGVDAVQVVEVESEDSGSGRSAGQLAALPGEAEDLEEGELNGAGAPAAEAEAEAPRVTTGAKKRKKKKEKEKEKEKVKVKPRKEARAGVVNTEDTKPEADAEESLAMRKLLRGPRYFDPPDEQGEMCYSCGLIGHRAADCTEQPRQKPCYVCGNFGHDGYDCPEKTECYECGESGHVARVCPNRYSKPRRYTGVCLLCGRLGHDASTCSGEYDPDDLKQVNCYICKRTGHMCCIEVVDASPTPVSCYQCGDLGHTGVGCKRLNGDRGDTLCFKCGQDGHFARDCQQMSRDYNIKQRRHSWPAPWGVDNGRREDREFPVIPACHIRPAAFKSRLEHVSPGKYKEHDYSRRGSKRKRDKDSDAGWTPRSTDSHHRRSRD